MKYNGLFFEYLCFPPEMTGPEYAGWSIVRYKKEVIDWCSAHNYNTLIFMGFSFCDPKRYPYMMDLDIPVNIKFKDLVDYAKKKDIKIYGGLRLDLSPLYVKNNPECKATYKNTSYKLSPYAWCLNNGKVKEFLKHCTTYYIERYDLDGIVYHSSEAPHCQCNECNKTNLFKITIDTLKILKPIIDSKKKETVLVTTSWRGFDDWLDKIDREVPGLIYAPWDYTDPGGSPTIPAFTPYSLEKRVRSYTDRVSRVWFIIPSGNYYMRDYVYPVPEVIKMWCEVLNKCKAEGVIGYCVSWSSSYLNRFTQGNIGLKQKRFNIEELIYRAFKEKFGNRVSKKMSLIYRELLDLIYTMWFSLPSGALRGLGYKEIVEQAQPGTMEHLMKKLRCFEERCNYLKILDKKNQIKSLSFYVNDIKRHIYRVKCLYNFFQAKRLLHNSDIEKAKNFYAEGVRQINQIFNLTRNDFDRRDWLALKSHFENRFNF